MADLATLGLAVDSSQVKSATSALQDFSKAGQKAEQSAGGVTEALSKARGPSAEFAKNFAAADAQQINYSKSANKVIDSLANQFVRLNSTKREWAQLSAIQKAGVDANSDAAGRIAAMAGALFDLEQAQKKVANDNATRMSRILGGSQIVAALGLFGIGFTQVFTAAKQLYDYLELAGPSAEATLKEQDRLVGIVKRSYDEATKSARNFYEQSRDVTRLQLLQQEIDLQTRLREEVGKTISGATTYGNIGDFFTKTRQIKESLLPFEDAIFKLKEGFDQGVPNVRAFADEVARIGLQSPELQKAAVDLIKSAGNASEFAEKLKAIKASLDLIEGRKLSDEGRAAIGIPQDRSGENLASAWDKQLSSLSRRNAAMEAEARTVGQSAATHEKMRTTLLLEDLLYNKGIKNIDAYRDQIEKAGNAAAQTTEKLARARIGDQIKFDRNTAFLTQEDVQIASQLRDIYPNVAEAMGSVEAQAMRMNNAMREVSQAIENNLTSGLTDIVSGTKSVKEGFSDMASSIIKEIERMVIKMMVVQPIMRSLQAAMGGFGFSFASGGTFGAGLSTTNHTGLYAKGGVFANDNVRAFANGGAFTNSIVSSPTLFRFAQGTGLMGEAGPEAIMPLKRGPDGSLGVRAAGGGAPVINIINQTSGKVEQGGTRRNADGSIDVFIRDAVRGVMLDDAAKNGDISKAMSARISGFNGR